MKKSKPVEPSSSRDRGKKNKSSQRLLIISSIQPPAKNTTIHKYLNTTLNLHNSEKSNNHTESVESKKANVIQKKRVNTPLYMSFKDGLNSSLQKSTKSKEKFGSTIKLNHKKKESCNKKPIILEDYLIREDSGRTLSIWKQVQKLLKQFDCADQFDDFQEYAKEVDILNQKVSNLLSTVEGSAEKQIVLKYKSLVSNMSKKCLSRLYDRHQTADVSMNALERIQLNAKQKYEKKITKLLHVIAQKQRKQKQVNKLLYYLRRHGVDIDEAWDKSLQEERRSKTQLQKRSLEDY